MKNPDQRRFLTVHFSQLQGLKAVPLYLLLVLIVIWSNIQTGPAPRSVLFPSLLGGVAALLYWLIDRHYKAEYGRVESLPTQQRRQYLHAVGGGLVGVAAAVVDLTQDLPLSFVGLAFAGAVVFEYFFIFRHAHSRFFFWQAAVTFTLIVGADLLPLFGFQSWYEPLGLRSHFLAVLVVVSLALLPAGILGHIYLRRQFVQQQVAL